MPRIPQIRFFCDPYMERFSSRAHEGIEIKNLLGLQIKSPSMPSKSNKNVTVSVININLGYFGFCSCR